MHINIYYIDRPNIYLITVSANAVSSRRSTPYTSILEGRDPQILGWGVVGVAADRDPGL